MNWAARISRWVLALAITASLGCSPGSDNGDSAGLRAAVDAFYDAVEAGDVEARIALFSEGAIMMPNHWVMSLGKEPIAEMIRGGGGWVFEIRDREVIDMDVSGDLAYTVNSYYYTYHASGSEPQWHKTKNVHIWKTDVSGEWKLHVDIWNSDVSMDAFEDE